MKRKALPVNWLGTERQFNYLFKTHNHRSYEKDGPLGKQVTSQGKGVIELPEFKSIWYGTLKELAYLFQKMREEGLIQYNSNSDLCTFLVGFYLWKNSEHIKYSTIWDALKQGPRKQLKKTGSMDWLIERIHANNPVCIDYTVNK